jgi:hypothetical protein
MIATTRRQAAILSLSGVTQKDKQVRPVGPRYSVQPANFPRQLWLVWDHRLGRNLAGAELNAKKPARFPWFTRESAAQRVVDRLNRTEN